MELAAGGTTGDVFAMTPTGYTVIVLANHKGGVTKTTSTANLGAMLAERGRRVLVIAATVFTAWVVVAPAAEAGALPQVTTVRVSPPATATFASPTRRP